MQTNIVIRIILKFVKNRKWGVIDTDGKIILPCIYDMIDDYKGGIDLLQIQKNGLFGLLDKKMQWVIPLPLWSF